MRVSKLIVLAVAGCASAHAFEGPPATVGEMAFIVGDWLQHLEDLPGYDERQRWEWRGKELVGEVYGNVNGRPNRHRSTLTIRATGKSIVLIEESYLPGSATERRRYDYFGVDWDRAHKFVGRDEVITYKLDGEGRLVRITYTTHQHGALQKNPTIFSRSPGSQ